MKLGLLTMAAALLGAGIASGDTLYLKDGSTKEGTIVSQNDKEILIKVAVGRLTATVTVARDEVVRIQKGLSVNDKLLQKISARRAALKDNDAEGWFQLGEWLGRQTGFEKDRSAAYEKAISIDPNHVGARKALGHQKIDGKWMSKDDAMAEQGLVPYRGEYVTPDERRILAERDDEIRAEIAKEMAAVANGETPLTDEERRRKEVDRIMQRDADQEMLRLRRRHHHRRSLLGRMGYYDMYPYYHNGLPVQSGVFHNGAFYGTLGHVPYAPATTRTQSGNVSPGINIPLGNGGAIQFGSNFANGGGFNFGAAGRIGSGSFGLSFGGNNSTSSSSSTTTVK